LSLGRTLYPWLTRLEDDLSYSFNQFAVQFDEIFFRPVGIAPILFRRCF